MINDRKDVLAHNLVRLPVEVWPLLKSGTTDYFTGVPVGITSGGEAVIGRFLA